MHGRFILRTGLTGFRRAYAQRDEDEAEVMVRTIVRRNDWWSKTLLSEGSINWFIDAVGLLMLAIMPRRDQNDETESLNVDQNWWKPSASASQLAEAQLREPYQIDAIRNKRYGTSKTTLAKRHVPDPDQEDKDFGSRSSLLAQLKIRTAERASQQSDIPPDIMQGFEAALNQAEADARVTDQYAWLPNFNLTIRPWRKQARQSQLGMTPAVAPANYNGPAPQQYTANAPPVPGPPQGQGPPGPSSGNAMSARRSNPGSPQQTIYYSIGEVGNHQSRTDLWALVDDGAHGFDIYDVTGEYCAI